MIQSLPMAPEVRRLAHGCAIVLIVVSFTLNLPWSRATHSVRGWEAHSLDPADYRLTAEHFWGVRSDPTTYHFGPLWRAEWANYLLTVPFRQIGTGTAYLAAGWLRLGRTPQTPGDVEKTGALLIVLEQLLMAIGLLAVFRSVLDGYGAAPALGALVALAFPPRMWRLAEDFMTEPLLRIVLLVLFAAVVRMASRRDVAKPAMVVLAMLALAVHIKVQWLVGVVLLAPAVVIAVRNAGRVRRASALAAVAIAIPLSLAAVNWIGWRTGSLSAGTGVHAHIKYGDPLLAAFCATRTEPPSFCDMTGARLQWWNTRFGGATAAEYAAFDRFAVRDVVMHPMRSISAFVDGLALASTLPGTETIGAEGLRFVDYPQPWYAVAGIVDDLAWTLLIVGLWIKRTRLIAWTALVFWIVPAAGNVIAVYELRYHQPMAGFALAAAVLIAFECRRWITVPSLFWPRGAEVFEHP